MFFSTEKKKNDAKKTLGFFLLMITNALSQPFTLLPFFQNAEGCCGCCGCVARFPSGKPGE